jgi:hypothetical protein
MTQTVPMAHLSGPNSAFVEFGITQYQFPSMDPKRADQYDLNWLRVEFRVCDGQRQWSRNDPAWLTDDIPRLAAWLRQVADGQAPEDAWTALEPLLTLECRRASPTVELVAELRLELRSDEAKLREPFDDPEVIMLAPSKDELLRAAAVLDEAARRLPPR